MLQTNLRAEESSTIDEFCTRYKISKPTFYREIESGRLRVMKVRDLTRISAQAEKDWITACEALPLSPVPFGGKNKKKLKAIR